MIKYSEGQSCPIKTDPGTAIISHTYQSWLGLQVDSPILDRSFGATCATDCQWQRARRGQCFVQAAHQPLPPQTHWLVFRVRRRGLLGLIQPGKGGWGRGPVGEVRRCTWSCRWCRRTASCPGSARRVPGGGVVSGRCDAVSSRSSSASGSTPVGEGGIGRVSGVSKAMTSSPINVVSNVVVVIMPSPDTGCPPPCMDWTPPGTCGTAAWSRPANPNRRGSHYY